MERQQKEVDVADGDTTANRPIDKENDELNMTKGDLGWQRMENGRSLSSKMRLVKHLCEPHSLSLSVFRVNCIACHLHLKNRNRIINKIGEKMSRNKS